MWHLVAAGGAAAIMLAWLLFGETGLFAWNDYSRLLTQRRAELTQLQQEQHMLANHRRLLDPRHADPDLIEEKLRTDMNYVHPGDVVVNLR